MKKIPFNDRYGLNQAVLEGRKTKTRRIINAPENATGCELLVVQKQHREYVSEKRVLMIHTTDHVGVKIDIPYQVGDEVAIAQSYEEAGIDAKSYHVQKVKALGTYHPAHVRFDCTAGWNNKMFVRADFMPHRIKITNVRVERLQDISEEDCLKEGIVHFHARGDRDKEDYGFGDAFWFTTPRKAFAALIDKICGRGTWDSNPYVLVYEFELVK